MQETSRLYIGSLADPLGNPVRIAAHDRAVVRIRPGGDEQAFVAELARRFGARTVEAPEHPLVRAVQSQLEEYFRGLRRTFDLPIELPGTPFQVRVWQALLGILYGETRTYRELARAIGAARAARAVGAANAANPVAIVVPCHRVIASGGALGGYGGGIRLKQFLLDLERSVIAARRPHPSA